MIAILIAGFFSACDSSSFLFSEADKKGIYTVALSTADEKNVSGAVLEPGSELSVALTKMSGATEPVVLALELNDAAGTSIATLNYASGDGAKSLSGAVAVSSLSGSLPTFTLPTNLSPGSYEFVTILKDRSGTELQRTETAFYIAASDFGLGPISVYPASPSYSPGTAVLLVASVKGIETASNAAWLRWSYDGKSIASGPFSSGLDKVVWKVPDFEGAYSVYVDLYPSEPTEAALKMASPWRQSIKAIAAKDPIAATDEFADGSRFISHLAFEGDFTDLGSRAQSEKPTAYGSPSLTAYPNRNGFGYRLGSTASVSIPGMAPPSVDGRPGAFSLLWRIYADKAQGELLRLTASDGSILFRAGLEDGKPYAELTDVDGLHRSQAEASVGAGLENIALSFEPKADVFNLVWSIDGERYAASPLPARLLPAAAKASLGGSAGLVGIYDEFAMSSDLSGRPPFYRAAAQRKYRDDLLLAEGFESLGLPAGATSEGQISYAFTRLGLGPNSRLAFAGDLSLSRPFLVEALCSVKTSSLVAELRNADSLLFSVESSGAISLPNGKVIGYLGPSDDASLAFFVKPLADGVEIASSSLLPVARITTGTAPKALRLALVNRTASNTVYLSRLLVRTAPEALSLADGARMARLR